MKESTKKTTTTNETNISINWLTQQSRTLTKKFFWPVISILIFSVMLFTIWTLISNIMDIKILTMIFWTHKMEYIYFEWTFKIIQFIIWKSIIWAIWAIPIILWVIVLIKYNLELVRTQTIPKIWLNLRSKKAFISLFILIAAITFISQSLIAILFSIAVNYIDIAPKQALAITPSLIFKLFLQLVAILAFFLWMVYISIRAKFVWYNILEEQSILQAIRNSRKTTWNHIRLIVWTSWINLGLFLVWYLTFWLGFIITIPMIIMTDCALYIQLNHKH